MATGDAVSLPPGYAIESQSQPSLPQGYSVESATTAQPASPTATISRGADKGIISQTADALVGDTNYTQEGRAEHPLLSRVGDFVKHVRGYGDLLGSIAKTGIVPFGEMEGIEAPEAAETVAQVSKPGKVAQVMKGEKVAQPAAQSAMRDAASSVTPTVQPLSIREGLTNPIDISEATYKHLYGKIDQAAGTDIKALREKLSNTEYNIRQLTDTEADQAAEAKLESARTGLIDKINEANKAAIANGVDAGTLQKADQTYQQTQALKDVESKVFKNPNVVVGNSKYGTNETVNIDSAVKALQRLEDNAKYGGSRLEQALGKEGADNLLRNLYQAQKSGQRAVDAQQLAKWIVGAAGIGGGIVAGGVAVKRAIE